MDYLLVCMLILLPILCYIAINLVFHKSKSSKNTDANLPPGSTGWPLFGETMELGMLGGKGIPEIFFQKRMKRYSQQVFKTSLIGEKSVILCGAAGNKFLFSNESKLVTMFFPRNLKKILPHLDEVEDVSKVTYKARILLAHFLKPEFLQNCVPIVNELARKHFDSKWVSQKEVKALPLIREYAFSVTCKLFLSVDDPKHIQAIAKPFNLLAAGIFGLPINFPGTAFNKAIKASYIIREKLFEIIRERKAHLMAGKSPGTHDIMWNMLTVPDDEGKFYNEQAIADNTLAFLLASQDAITTAITFIVKSLTDYHHVYHQVLKEQRSIAQDKQSAELNWKDLQKMKYTWNAASEALRLMAPAQGGFREAITDFTYYGFLILKGWKGFLHASDY